MKENVKKAGSQIEGTKDAVAASLPLQTTNAIGSLTFGTLQAPQGQVMKLHLMNIQPQEDQNPEPTTQSQLFGTHIREAIAIVKDWRKKALSDGR